MDRVDPMDTARQAETTRKADVDTEVRAPPRPSQGSADVHIRQTADEKVRLDIKTSEGSGKGGGWPSEEEWRRWLKAAAPWLVAAAVIAMSATVYNKMGEDEGLDNAARRKAREAKKKAGKAVDDAADSAKHGWFGLKRAAADAAGNVEGNWAEAKGKAGTVVEDVSDAAKSGWFGAKKGAEDVADEAKQKLHNTKDAAKGYAARADDYVGDKAHEAKEMAKQAGHYVGDKLHEAAETTKHAAQVTADAAKRTAGVVEDAAAKTGSKVVAKASEAENTTGRVVKEGGEKLEKDGAQRARYYRATEPPKQKKWFGLF